MAVIALMEKEFVHGRRLMSAQEFTHGIGLSQALGAFAVNVSVFVGYRLFGVTGALLSAGVFLTPSVALIILLSDLYFRYHAVPTLRGAVQGVAPVVIALILNAAWAIGKNALRSRATNVIAFAAFIAGFLQVNALWILLESGVFSFLLPTPPLPLQQPLQSSNAVEPGSPRFIALALPIAMPLSAIAATFLKIGTVFVGGGFVLVPLLHNRLVSQLGWLQPQEFLDGLAISNLTPGPVAVLATFAGYRMAGLAGALAATAALFAPSILLMLVITHEYHQFRDNHRVKRFLAGTNPAVAGLILSAGPLLGRTALVSWRGYTLLALSLVLLARLRWPPAAVLALGALAGYSGLLP